MQPDSQAPSPAPRPPRTSRFEPLVDRERRNPLLRWMVHLGLPVSASVAIHSLVFVTLALSTWTVLREREYSAGEFEAGIVADVGGRGLDSLRWPEESIIPPGGVSIPESVSDFQASDFASLREVELAEVNPGLAGEDGGGFGLGESGLSGIIGTGSGAGDGGGAGFGAGFGSGGGIGQAGVWDLRVGGNTFCYVVDFSGSIVVAVDDLKRELKRSIGRLRPNQSFNVFIFYSTAGQRDRFMTESFAAELQPARTDVKRQFFEWIDSKAPQGSTEPLVAVRRALRMEPEVVFFFSDGYFDDVVVSEVARENRGVRARIHCLVFDELLLQDTSGLPRMTKGAYRLKRIADENGGRIKVVTGADLKRR